MTAHGLPLSFESDSRKLVSNDDDWLDPQSLGGELPPVVPFDPSLMPSAMLPLVEDTAERMQVPLDFPAVVTAISLAGAKPA